MQGYFNFSISKPLLAYVEEGGFNEKIPRRQNLPTGRNIQGRLKMIFQTAFDSNQTFQRMMPRVDSAKKSLNTASSAWVSARCKISTLASSNGMPR